MRGKHNFFRFIKAVTGITPAGAGKTVTVTSKMYNNPDHPPQVRGKPYVCACRGRGHRITPAHAGKTDGVTHDIGKWEDHPRACGENGNGDSAIFMKAGSPPRMRGKLSLRSRQTRKNRITPAHAGKTFLGQRFDCFNEDHPRACGENRRRTFREWQRSGSPPRMRGKRNSLPCCNSRHRITPADAGKTHSSPHVPFMTRDHPRGCGENPYSIDFISTRIGSPPRMRGKRT